MKRLLLLAICVATLAGSAVATASSPRTTASAIVLTAVCGTGGTVCPLGQTVTFYASGLDPKKSWEKCYTQVDQTSPCLPVPITDPISPDGTVTFTLDGSIFRTAGVYTVYLLLDQGRNHIFEASVAVLAG